MFLKIKKLVKKLMGREYPYLYQKCRVEAYAKRFPQNSKTLPTFDIIMPVLNRAKVTKKTIETLFKNTQCEFQLIIVDNNSNLETKAALKKLTTKYKNINIISLAENQGAAEARNKGLQHCKNKYVAFLDNDILIAPGYFEHMLEILQRNPKIAGVQSKVVLPTLKIQINNPLFIKEDKWILFYEADKDKPFDQTSNEAQLCNWIGIGATLWNREILRKFNFDSKFRTNYEDNELSYRIGSSGFLFSNSPKSLCLHFSAQFVPRDQKNTDYMLGRFSKDEARNSAKSFYKKHKKVFAYGDKQGYAKYLGFGSAQEYLDFIENS